MDEQFSLFELPRQEARDCLFVALVPDIATAGEIARIGGELLSKHGLKGKLRPTEHFHLTLLHVGNFDGLPPKIVEAVERSCQAAADRVKAFEMELNLCLSFSGKPGNLPMVLACDKKNPELETLHSEVVLQIAKQGVSPEGKSGFKAHVTLSYIKRHVLKEMIPPLTWQAKDIVLIHSLQGQAKHIELGRWTLEGH
jgi:2'-5' RNA ligase